MPELLEELEARYEKRKREMELHRMLRDKLKRVFIIEVFIIENVINYSYKMMYYFDLWKGIDKRP